jgi:asparagine synthase (glutamine-hydrolysing)
MSFIFGIVDFGGGAVRTSDIQALADGFKWEGFIDQIETFGDSAFGFCGHPERKTRAGVYHDAGLIVAADIRIYNHDKLKSFFDYSSPEQCLAMAYRRWGEECAAHINGDFAAAIYDREKKRGPAVQGPYRREAVGLFFFGR